MSTARRGFLEIACDESGNTGENLAVSGGQVFSEGSHDLSMSESEDVVNWIHGQLQQPTAEIKWKNVRSDLALVEELFGDRLRGRAHFYLSEKSYFVVGKVVDLLIEELAHSRGANMYDDGSAKRLALQLYRGGPRALGETHWNALLKSFNSLMRRDSRTQRLKAIPKVTVAEFYSAVDECRWLSRRRSITEILNELAETMPFADEFVNSLDPESRPIPSLDPLVPSLAQTIRHWFSAAQCVEIAVLHDEGAVPSSEAMDAMVDGLRHPREFWRSATAVNVSKVSTASSATDPRLQIADLVAGLGAASGALALKGEANSPLLELAQFTIFPTSLWGDEASGELLGLES